MIRQAAKVTFVQNDTKKKDFDPTIMRTGERGVMRFRFMYHPEHIKEGDTFLFREGKTKGLGEITRVFLPEKVTKANTGAYK